MIRKRLVTAMITGALVLVGACSEGSPPETEATTQQPAAAPSSRPNWSPAPVVPLDAEPPAKLVVDKPLPQQLSQGLVVIRYRAENARLLPVYGQDAKAVTPRLGHIHVVVDDAPWHWADGSGEPLILQGLPPGPHHVWIGLADPTHKVMDSATIAFMVPDRNGQNGHGH